MALLAMARMSTWHATVISVVIALTLSPSWTPKPVPVVAALPSKARPVEPVVTFDVEIDSAR